MNMNQNKPLSLACRGHLNRAGKRLLVTLLATCAAILLKATLVHAETTAKLEDLAGTWEMVDGPTASAPLMVKVSSHPDRILLSLPQAQVRLASGQDVALVPCAPRAYCSPSTFSPAVRFELTARNRAALSIHGNDVQGIAALELPLRRETAD